MRTIITSAVVLLMLLTSSVKVSAQTHKPDDILGTWLNQ